MSDTEEMTQTFDGVSSGASHCIPTQAGSIKKGAHVLLKGKPCKVVDYSTSKTGKHGHAKAHIVGLDIFTNRKYEDICPTSHNMLVPIVKRTEHLLLDISGDSYLSLLMDDGGTKDDLKLPTDGDNQPDDVAKGMQQMFDSGKSIVATVLEACGQQKIVAFKESTGKEVVV